MGHNAGVYLLRCFVPQKALKKTTKKCNRCVHCAQVNTPECTRRPLGNKKTFRFTGLHIFIYSLQYFPRNWFAASHERCYIYQDVTSGMHATGGEYVKTALTCTRQLLSARRGYRGVRKSRNSQNAHQRATSSGFIFLVPY
jgi:hypothetical protein